MVTTDLSLFLNTTYLQYSRISKFDYFTIAFCSSNGKKYCQAASFPLSQIILYSEYIGHKCKAGLRMHL